MGTGWNYLTRVKLWENIITDWDMGTGWNINRTLEQRLFDYNRLGYGYWLELVARAGVD